MAENNKPEPKLVRPMDIPIYGASGECCKAKKDKAPEKVEERPGAFYSAVSEVRKGTQELWGQIGDVRTRANEIVETGKAHSMATLDMLRDEDNVQFKAGFIGGGVVLGFIFGSFARRARFLKRIFYTGLFGGGAAAVCYPLEAQELSKIAYEESKSLSLIAYNFVQGVQLQPSSSGAEKPSATEASPSKADEKTPFSNEVKTDQSNPADKDMYTTRSG